MQNRTDESVSELQANLDQAEQAGQVGTWRWNVSGTQVEWSDGTYRIFGRRRSEFPLTPESFYSCVHPLDRERARKLLAEALQRPAGGEVEFRISRPDGLVRWVRAVAKPLVAQAGKPVRMGGSVQDLTAQRQLEDQLRLAQRRELLGLLAGGIAHDFNNLLTVIRGRSEMVVDEPGLSEFARESLVQVVEAVDRAASLTRQLTAFSRSQVVQIQPCDLNKVITHLMKMLRRILGEQFEIQLQLAPDLPLAQADPGMVEHLLMNLAVLTRDALPRGGQIRLSTEAAPASATAAKGSGRFARVTVCHSPTRPGAGYPDLTSGESGGQLEPAPATRSGWPAVQEISAQLHGWVDLSSTSDGTSLIQVFLPLVVQVNQAEQGGRGKLDLRGGSERILLVEDDQGLRTFIGLLLGRLGYAIKDAVDGPDALRRWGEQAGEFDLLLTDVIMPSGMTGWELAEALRKQKPGLRAIAMTGYSEEAGKPASITGVQCVSKPFTPEGLAQAVRACLDAAVG